MENEMLKSLEALRKKMYELIEEKGIDHPEVLAASQLMDEMHNQFNRTHEIKGAPRKHIRVEPTGERFEIFLVDGESKHPQGEGEKLQEVLDLALKLAESRKPNLKVYYLEQRIQPD